MYAKGSNKALFRAKLNAQKNDKRISSCTALSNFKATSAGLNQVNNTKAEAGPELPKSKPEHSVELHIPGPERSTELPRKQSSSELPPDFFDNHDAKKQNTGRETVQTRNIEPAKDLTQTSSQIASSEAKQIKGALPEGFFDNKEADVSARGIKPGKQDVNPCNCSNAILDRLGSSQILIDAGETIEEAESVEQRAYREKVELLKKKKMALKAAIAAKRRRLSEVVKKESSHGESSSDSDTDENFAVDWRAQHL
ncbi:hypothetical protein C1H46_033174 [Malus baccata]|uniref:Uncharacterized protein n=1 Tax=Malus baccata TaxID=106549 RepID=A0A540L4Q9_MALBA|nr:hypothetical protein C1H46_033174 [Malus baccata]